MLKFFVKMFVGEKPSIRELAPNEFREEKYLPRNTDAAFLAYSLYRF